MWNGGTASTSPCTETKTVSWTISPIYSAKPSLSQTSWDYSGSSINASNKLTGGYNTDLVDFSGTLSASNAGTYEVTYTLKDTSVTLWNINALHTEGDDFSYPSGAESYSVVIRWKIKPILLTAAQSTFTVSGEYYYNGSEQTVTISGYNANYHEISGNTGEKPGSYTAQITPKENYAFSDGTTDTKTVSWEIKKAVVRLDNTPAAFETINGTRYLVWRPTYTYDENTTINIGEKMSTTSIKGSVGNDFHAGNGSTYSAQNASTYQCDIVSAKGKLIVTPVGGNVISMEHEAIEIEWTISGSSETASVLKIIWTINRAKLSTAQSSLSGGTYTYKGAAYDNPISNYNATYHTGGVVSSPVNAGTYNYTIYPTSNYAWSDGTTGGKAVTVTINPLSLAKPSAIQSEFTYDSATTVAFLNSYINGYDSATMTAGSTLSAQNAGDYSITFALKNTTNYKWNDNTTAQFQINWKINSQKLTKPSPRLSSFVYTGSQINLADYLNYYDSAKMAISNNTMTDVGSATASVTVTNPRGYTNYTWSDGSTDAVSIEWSITPQPLDKPYCKYADTNIQWTGTKIDWREYAIVGYDSTAMTCSATYYATDRGNYSFSIGVKNNNYAWKNTDQNRDPVTFSWSIVPQRLTNALSGPFYVTDGDIFIYKGTGFTCHNQYNDEKNAFFYIGATRNITIKNFDATYHRMYKVASGGSVANQSVMSDVAEYTYGIEPHANYSWADGTRDRKTFSVVVTKAPLKVVWTEGYDSLIDNGKGVEISVTDDDYYASSTDGLRKIVKFQLVDHRGQNVSSTKAGAISFERLPTHAAISDELVSVSYPNIYFYGHENWTYDLRLRVDESDYYKATYDDDYYDDNAYIALYVNRSLATIPSWARIKELSDAGKLTSYGIDEAVGHSRSNGGSPTTAALRPWICLGTVREGSEYRSAWMYCKADGVDGHYARTDSKYGQTVTSGDYYAHNSGAASTNLSWSTSNMRAKCTAFYDSNMASIKAYVTPRTIDGNVDYVWLLTSNRGDYDYFIAGNCAPFHDSNGNEVQIWTRECWYDATDGERGYALTFNGNGCQVTEVDAHMSLGFVPCFLI